MDKVRIGGYIKQIRGVSYKPTDLHNDLNADSVILLRSNNISEGKVNFDDVVYVDKSKVKEEQYLKKGDILVCASSGSKELVGKAAFVKKDFTATFGAFCKLIRPTACIAEYLGHYFNSQIYREKISSLALGANINNIRNEHIDELCICFPNEMSQKSISLILNKVTNIVDKRKEQLEKLDELVKARFVELFGDVANNPKYDGIPLGTICSTLSGGTPTTKVPEYYQGDIPWISTPYLGNNHINGSSAKAYITEDAIKNSATHLIPANTIMFGIRVGVGKSSIIDEPMCANQDIVALMGIDTSKYNLLFVKHTLDSYQSHFDSIKKGATILGVTTEDLKKVLIPVVDVELQNQFAAFVEQTDKSKLEVQKSLEKLELLKKALMQKYFG